MTTVIKSYSCHFFVSRQNSKELFEEKILLVIIDKQKAYIKKKHTKYPLKCTVSTKMYVSIIAKRMVYNDL